MVTISITNATKRFLWFWSLELVITSFLKLHVIVLWCLTNDVLFLLTSITFIVNSIHLKSMINHQTMLNQILRVTILKKNVCFDIAQYPIRWSTQSALHFTCSFWHHVDFSRKHSSDAERLFIHISTTIYIQCKELWTASWRERKCPNFTTVAKAIRTRLSRLWVRHSTAEPPRSTLNVFWSDVIATNATFQPAPMGLDQGRWNRVETSRSFQQRHSKA